MTELQWFLLAMIGLAFSAGVLVWALGRTERGED